MKDKKQYFEFEDYLAEVHGKDYMGFDDDMPDDFNDWVSNLSEKELAKYRKDFKSKKHL